MKKKIYLSLFLSMIACHSLLSQISFNQTTYKVGDNIVAMGTSLVTGIENGISGLSQTVNFGTPQITLGKVNSPGFYLVTFNLTDNTKKMFLIGVSPATTALTEKTVYDLNFAQNSKASQKSIFEKVFKFFKEQPNATRFAPFSKGLQSFCVNNAVDLVHNVSFCLAATQTGIPAITIICSEMSKSNLEALSTEVFKELFKQMKTSGYLTQTELTTILSNIDDLANIKEIIGENCSGLFNFLANKIENAQLKMALQYQGQLCNSTVLIIKEFKKLP